MHASHGQNKPGSALGSAGIGKGTTCLRTVGGLVLWRWHIIEPGAGPASEPALNSYLLRDNLVVTSAQFVGVRCNY